MRAMLETMVDGEEHAREILVDIGARACSPDYALGMWQRAQRTPSRADKVKVDFDALTREDQLKEIATQEVKGARMQATKALSHLESFGCIEPVGLTTGPSGRVLRRSFRITQRGRERLVSDDLPPRKLTEITAEQRRAISLKGLETKRANGLDLSEVTRRANETKRANGLDLSEVGRKAWETRRARLAQEEDPE